MEAEQKLADLLFGHDPVRDLKVESDRLFQKTDHQQFARFYERLLKRIEERLSQQFGACIALIEEKCGLDPDQLAKDFVRSPEFRQVREDISDLNQTSPARFEIGFLHFVLRSQQDKSDFIDEFGEIYLRELALS